MNDGGGTERGSRCIAIAYFSYEQQLHQRPRLEWLYRQQLWRYQHLDQVTEYQLLQIC